jgi:hypothetical protein
MRKHHGNYRRKHGKRAGRKPKHLRDLIAVRDRLSRLIERIERR